MASCTRRSDDEEAAGALLGVTLILYGTYHPHRSTRGMRECQPHTLLWQHNICICKHLKIKFFLKEKFHIFHKTSFLTLPPTCCQKTLTTGTVMCNYSDPWLPLPNPTPSSTVCVNSPGARNFHTYTDTHTSLAVSMQHTAPSSLSL